MALRSLPGEVPGSVAGAVDLGLGSGIPVMQAGGAGGLIGGRGGGGGWDGVLATCRESRSSEC